MNIFPYRKRTFRTRKTTSSVALLLLRAVPPDGNRLPLEQRTVSEYYGSVWEDSFTIVPNINFGNKLYPLATRHNPFTPIFNGKLTSTSDGTTIEVRSVPHLYALVPALIFLLFFGFWVVFAASAERNGQDTVFLSCTIMLFLGLAAAVWMTYSHVTDENRRLADFLHRTVLAKPFD